jgi:hypothetical protein
MRTTPASVYAIALDAYAPRFIVPSHLSLSFATVAIGLLGGSGVAGLAMRTPTREGHQLADAVVVALFAMLVVVPALAFLHARKKVFLGALAVGACVTPLVAAALIAGPQAWNIAPPVVVGLGTPPAARAIEEREGRAVWWVVASIGLLGACAVSLLA